MEIIPDAVERLAHVRAAAGLAPVAPPRLLESHSNDTWLLDDAERGSAVLRVSWRGDVDRLEREVAVAAAMPKTVRYPEVLTHGRTCLDGVELSYSLTRRLAGVALDGRWPSLSDAQRRSAVSQLAVMLRDLHTWTPPATLVEPLLARWDLAGDDITGLLGADITPLPVARAVRLAEHAKGIRHVDPHLMADVIGVLDELGPLAQPVDDPTGNGVVHGDLHLSNLLWSDAGEVTLLDFEWVRFGPPLLDLQRLCENADSDVLNGVDTHPTVLRWLESDYPEPFGAEHAPERVRLYSLVYAIRHVIVAPPDRDATDLPPDHSLHRLRRLVEGTWPQPSALPESLAP
jgi:hypothetical protein